MAIATDVIVPDSEPRIKRPIVCEFCECKLSREGDVIKRGDKARAMMDLSDRCETLTRELEQARARIAELTTAHPPSIDDDADTDDEGEY